MVCLNSGGADSLCGAIAAVGRHGAELWVPENGFASLNVPLAPERRASLSTRTTHPAFLDGVQATLHQAGIAATITNPFESKTKGGLVADLVSRHGEDPAATILSLTPPRSSAWICRVRRPRPHRLRGAGDRRRQYRVRRPCTRSRRARAHRSNDRSARARRAPSRRVRRHPLPAGVDGGQRAAGSHGRLGHRLSSQDCRRPRRTSTSIASPRPSAASRWSARSGSTAARRSPWTSSGPRPARSSTSLPIALASSRSTAAARARRCSSC